MDVVSDQANAVVTAILLGVAASCTVLWAGVMHAGTSPAQRVRALRVEAGARNASWLGALLDWLGGLAWQLLRKLRATRAEPNAEMRRSLGITVVAVVTIACVSVWLGVIIAVTLYLRAVVARRSSHRRRARVIQREVPMLIDIFRISLNTGLNVTMTTTVVTRWIDGPLKEELELALHRVSQGARIVDALEDVVARTCEELRPLVAALASAERYGSPLSAALERVAYETRIDQERCAERAAKRLSIELLFPVAGCTLPAFALLTAAPLLAGSFGSLASSLH